MKEDGGDKCHNTLDFILLQMIMAQDLPHMHSTKFQGAKVSSLTKTKKKLIVLIPLPPQDVGESTNQGRQKEMSVIKEFTFGTEALVSVFWAVEMA